MIRQAERQNDPARLNHLHDGNGLSGQRWLSPWLPGRRGTPTMVCPEEFWVPTPYGDGVNVVSVSILPPTRNPPPFPIAATGRPLMKPCQRLLGDLPTMRRVNYRVGTVGRQAP